jgi:hypothetical protein
MAIGSRKAIRAQAYHTAGRSEAHQYQSFQNKCCEPRGSNRTRNRGGWPNKLRTADRSKCQPRISSRAPLLIPSPLIEAIGWGSASAGWAGRSSRLKGLANCPLGKPSRDRARLRRLAAIQRTRKKYIRTKSSAKEPTKILVTRRAPL